MLPPKGGGGGAFKAVDLSSPPFLSRPGLHKPTIRPPFYFLAAAFAALCWPNPHVLAGCCSPKVLQKLQIRSIFKARGRSHVHTFFSFLFLVAPLRRWRRRRRCSLQVIKGLRKHTKALLDAHLMVSHPAQWVDDMADAGVDRRVCFLCALVYSTCLWLVRTFGCRLKPTLTNMLRSSNRRQMYVPEYARVR